jgi:hypothetical protein
MITNFTVKKPGRHHLKWQKLPSLETRKLKLHVSPRCSWKDTIPSAKLLPKTYARSLIMSKRKTNLNWGTFHKATGLLSSEMSWSWKTTKELSQIEGDQRSVTTYGVCDPGLATGPPKNGPGQVAEHEGLWSRWCVGQFKLLDLGGCAVAVQNLVLAFRKHHRST